jgi:dolichol-phosphate mannosyltransferase
VLKRGESIFEAPIRYYPRSKKEGKKIRWSDGLLAIWTLVKFRFLRD